MSLKTIWIFKSSSITNNQELLKFFKKIYLNVLKFKIIFEIYPNKSEFM
ncbi:8704_t:CDS:2 [Cetraspora pellucida]|uniref:8704_t:CDS:1 n=1 Tax=Cetraspora pellucida TaxID=1433469 RepID=A0A9N8VZJ9_9GLOM|nr:8704_t:CDS:2 [Cetraspora pellucida]